MEKIKPDVLKHLKTWGFHPAGNEWVKNDPYRGPQRIAADELVGKDLAWLKSKLAEFARVPIS